MTFISREHTTIGIWCALVAGSCVGFSLAMHPGIPAYRHDWQWPVESASLIAWFNSKLDPWNWQGLGAPNIAIQVHPFFLLTALTAFILPSKFILGAWLTAAAAAAAAGAGLFAAFRFGVSRWPAIATGALYALSPLVVNKMVAGHVAYLLAYAGIPWLLLCASSRHRAAPWATGLSLAWIGMQVQLLLFAIVLALFCAPKSCRLRNLLPSALATGTIVPYAWGLLRPAAMGLTSAMRTSTPWEMAQSLTVAEALRGVGYFAGYWETAVASFFGSAWLPWAYPWAIAVVLLIRRDAHVLRLAAAYVAGVLVLSGLKGPLAIPVGWLFGRVGGASAFRELYDAAIFLTFPGAVSAGIALSAWRNAVAQSVMALPILVLAVAPWLTGGVLKQTGSAFFAPTIQPLPNELAQHPARFYLAPGANPVGPTSLAQGGADPAAFNAGHLAPFWSYLVHGHEGAVIWTLQQPDKKADGMATSLGIAALVLQPDLVTKFSFVVTSGKNLRIHEFPGSFGRGGNWSNVPGATNFLVRRGVAASIVRLLPVRLRTTDNAPSKEQPLPATHGLPINAGWVPAQDWWFLSRRVAEAAPHGVITSAKRVPLFLPCSGAKSTTHLYAAGDGHVGTVLVDPDRWQDVRAACGDDIQVTPKRGEFIVISSAADIAAWQALLALGTLPSLPIDARQDGDNLVITALRECRRCMLVLSEGAFGGWLLSVHGQIRAATKLQSGFNGWPVDVSRGDVLRVFYAPSHLAALLEWCAAACWLWLIAGLGWEALRIQPKDERAYGR